MESVDSEKMSLLLSLLVEDRYLETAENVDFIKRCVLLKEHLGSLHPDDYSMSIVGSQSEGLKLAGADFDMIFVNNRIEVKYPDQCIPPNMGDKTILYVKEAGCRPGYVHLQVGHKGKDMEKHLFDSIVKIEDSYFLSSDMYREKLIDIMGPLTGLKISSTGPSCTTHGVFGSCDYVFSFPSKNWPNVAQEWITRTRLYGWPCQTLIDKIVNGGCQFVPTGDKCSDDTFLQWRISFVKAERSLIHSFSHCQMKVYTLLKCFLRQIKSTLKEALEDEDMLCSYFLKTVLFHALENTSQIFWQDKNLFFCFWFCISILITCVKEGFCSNFFIPRDNMFKRKIRGQKQQILLDVLNNYWAMKWKCLSVGDFFVPSIWDDLCNASVMERLAHRPTTMQKSLIEYDKDISTYLSSMCVSDKSCTETTIRDVVQALWQSQSDFDEVVIYNYLCKCLHRFSCVQIYSDNIGAIKNNKTRYRSLRKHQHWITHGALLGTDLLHLATFYFLIGNFNKALEMCKSVHNLSVCSRSDLRPDNGDTYNRLRKKYTEELVFQHKDLYPPHLSLEIPYRGKYVLIPPDAYNSFLSFLCRHELGDTRGRDAALRHLVEIQYKSNQQGRKSWIVHTIVGICHQILGNYHQAISAYWESSETKDYEHVKNTAITRIAIAYLCMCATQKSVKDSIWRYICI
ncbi:uncharacterized protein LOC132548398 [Ylistrum balloti]|uniref:uncharacterized protein LOC132548398 n=1 Tax=Ylistrum balloti TaxID=509963 RepID=UPI002905E6E0|nr:uncharacterized protein LOC132548398 [Ylistrum balloti]